MLNSTQIKELLIQASRCTNESGYTHDIMPLVPQLILAIESQAKAIENLCGADLPVITNTDPKLCDTCQNQLCYIYPVYFEKPEGIRTFTANARCPHCGSYNKRFVTMNKGDQIENTQI